MNSASGTERSKNHTHTVNRKIARSSPYSTEKTPMPARCMGRERAP